MDLSGFRAGFRSPRFVPDPEGVPFSVTIRGIVTSRPGKLKFNALFHTAHFSSNLEIEEFFSDRGSLGSNVGA